MDYIGLLEKEQIKKNATDFKPGDIVKIYLNVKEGEKERLQIFEGTVVGKKGEGLREIFRVRRISYGVGVERTFALNSPLINKIVVVKRGQVRRAKLYYLESKSSKDSRIKEQAASNEEIAIKSQS